MKRPGIVRTSKQVQERITVLWEQLGQRFDRYFDPADYNDIIWNGIRQIIVYKGLSAKFSQNEKLRENLKKTGSAILAECAVKDRVWGIGLSMKNPDRFDMNKWNGQNLLGFSIMQVRKQI